MKRLKLRARRLVLRRIRSQAHRAAVMLHEVYGSPRHENKDDPLDELMFIVLSQMTTHRSLQRAYKQLKRACPTWSRIVEMSEARLKDLIGTAGLAERRASQLRAIVQRLQQDFGEATLELLRLVKTSVADKYLQSLPGVGPKTAKCVLLFSLGREVLPVDTHVRRVAVRLGLVAPDVSYGALHTVLENVVPRKDRYAFHVNAVAHGRTLCLARTPRCRLCLLRHICRFDARLTRPGQQKVIADRRGVRYKLLIR
jgi:endonuclease III